MFLFFSFGNTAASNEDFQKLKEDILSYFPIISGSVKKSEPDLLILDKGLKDGIKKGQRVILFEETVPLIHPVTKQIIGKSEKIVGSAEIISVENNFSRAVILEGDIKTKNNQIFFKIPKSKIKILYAQTNTEWAVGEAYYRELKKTERFELIDAPVNIDNKEILLKDHKGADILLMLIPSKTNGNLKISQELYWTKDKKLLSKSELELTPIALSEFRKKYASLIVPEGHTILSYRLSRSINRISTGNFDGISPNQILIASDSEISLYIIDVDLKLKSNYLIPISGDILWFDTGDIDRDGKDEIVITIKKDNRIISSIIRWKQNEFVEAFRLEDIFLRIYDGRLIAQAFSQSLGFDGEIFYIKPSQSGYDKLEPFRLPVRANIYDFYLLGNSLFKWEEDGSLVVYTEKGIPLWRSPEPMGFGLQYEKQTGISMLSLGKWKVHSRIKPLSNGVIVIDKKPLLGLVNLSTFGYRSSKLQLLQWTGIGIEQTDITEEISGEILDYSVSSDKLFVLVKPPFGINPKRILQGESPFETLLHILSFKY
ncbi:MAG: VCBS repeat-containing protein [Thermodesulfovibrio sp.]|nr:VCBS repeat-containing protein [Thermodesulfovibrio sp.]